MGRGLGDHASGTGTTSGGATGTGDGSYGVAGAAETITCAGGVITITVAVTEVEAPRVAFALSQATITLALTPPGTFAPDDAGSGSTGS